MSAASAVQFAALAASSLILAAILSVEDFAVTRVVTAYLVVLTLLGHFCIGDAVASRIAATKDEECRSDFISTGGWLIVTFSIGAMLIMQLLIRVSELWAGPLREALVLTVAFVPLASLTVLGASVLQAVGAYRKLVLVTVIGGLVPAVSVVAGAKAWDLPGWILGRNLSYVVLLCVSLWVIRFLLLRLSFIRKNAVDLLSFARLQIISGLLGILVQVLDVILMERLSGDLVQVAVYGLAAQLSKAVLLLPAAMGSVFFRDIAGAQRGGSSMWGHANRFLLAGAAACIFAAVAVWILGPEAIRYLYGDQYAGSIPVLKVMCLGIVANGLWTLLSVTNTAIGRPSYSVAIAATGLLVAIPLLVLWIPAFGAMGAAWAMNVAFGVGAVVGLLSLFVVERRMSPAVAR